VPDYVAYLAHILAHMGDQPERVRSIAGFLLKNNARLVLTNTTPAAAAFVKASVLAAFQDTNANVRAAASAAIVTLLGTLEPRNWPECLQMLVAALDSPEAAMQEVRKCCAPLTTGFSNPHFVKSGRF
jgi:transportin-1